MNKQNERMISVLKFVKENAGTSLSRIIRNLKQIGAKTTLINVVKQMKEQGFLTCEKRERRGQADKYYITDKGIAELIQLPKALRAKKGLIRIGFSADFLKHFGDEEDVKRFVELLNKPEGKNLVDLIGSTIVFYLRNVKEPLFSIEYIAELNRFFFTGSLPQEISKLILQAVDCGQFATPREAFDFILSKMGICGFIGALKGGLCKKPEKLIFTLTPISYTPQNGYVIDPSKGKATLQRIPAEQLENKMLQLLSVWEGVKRE